MMKLMLSRANQPMLDCGTITQPNVAVSKISAEHIEEEAKYIDAQNLVLHGFTTEKVKE